MISNNFLECSKCKYSGDNFSSLEFHHVRDKKFVINRALLGAIKVSVQELFDEIQKCVVLCSNCHRMEHFDVEKFNKMKLHIDYKMEHHKELRPSLDRDEIYDMYFSRGMRQVDIVNHFKCSKGTISLIINNLAKEEEHGVEIEKS